MIYYFFIIIIIIIIIKINKKHKLDLKDKTKDHIKTLTKGQKKIKRKKTKLNTLIKRTQKPDEKKKP